MTTFLLPTERTTLLQILANSIPEQERILVIEDTPELQIRKPNLVAAGSQTSTFNTNVSFDELLKDTLRFRPDRIILGEVRGIEARTLLAPSTLAMPVRWPRFMPTRQRKRFTVSPTWSYGATPRPPSPTPKRRSAKPSFVVHVERHPRRRIVREVLALRGYDRDAKCFLIEPVFEVQHATA